MYLIFSLHFGYHRPYTQFGYADTLNIHIYIYIYIYCQAIKQQSKNVFGLGLDNFGTQKHAFFSGICFWNSIELSTSA